MYCCTLVLFIGSDWIWILLNLHQPTFFFSINVYLLLVKNITIYTSYFHHSLQSCVSSSVFPRPLHHCKSNWRTGYDWARAGPSRNKSSLPYCLPSHNDGCPLSCYHLLHGAPVRTSFWVAGECWSGMFPVPTGASVGRWSLRILPWPPVFKNKTPYSISKHCLPNYVKKTMTTMVRSVLPCTVWLVYHCWACLPTSSSPRSVEQ